MINHFKNVGTGLLFIAMIIGIVGLVFTFAAILLPVAVVAFVLVALHQLGAYLRK